MLTGSIYMFAGSVIPSGFLLCDGSAVSRTDYVTLFDVIGTTYGAGDGSTTFNLPDLSGRVSMGVSQDYVLGANGGEESHALVDTELPSHSHGIPAHGHGSTIKATTPKFTHSITQPAFNYNRPNGTGGAGNGSGSASGFSGTSSVNATTTSATVSAHAAADCTMSGSITDSPAFDTEPCGSGSSHNNMQPFITLNYIICSE